MKSSAALNSLMPPDPRATPSVFQAAVQDVIKHVTALMCLHGIKTLQVQVTQVGSRSVLHKDYVPLPVQPPISTIGRCTSASVAWIAAWRSAL